MPNADCNQGHGNTNAIVESLTVWLAARPNVANAPLKHAARDYGVGAGDSAGDGEGISDAEPSVFGGFLFAAPADLCRVRVFDGVGDGLVTAAAVVVVAVVPCCSVQEAINAMPTMAPIKYNIYLFIVSQFHIEYRITCGCLKTSERGTSEAF